ncbi:hypothetical protein [Nocardioides convexus]|uniref:hypothetical protein n=1 Tax=Nocardioides convexus TaxID=2712224 RepID=UPI00241864BA|nr:hypothetical protein [Nocardioides convexus]
MRGEVEGLDEDAFQAAAGAAKVGCPVSKALSGVTITLDAALERLTGSPTRTVPPSRTRNTVPARRRSASCAPAPIVSSSRLCTARPPAPPPAARHRSGAGTRGRAARRRG